jgi:hypothetical protein
MYVYYAALGGMGVSLDEFFAVVEASADDGVMFGEAEISVIEPLKIGSTYRVDGEITSAVRKAGKRAGVFDIVSFELKLTLSERHLATSTNSFVFPRRA